MKNSLNYLFILLAIALISCGPSAEEKAAVEKAKQDSIATAEAKAAEEAKAAADSMLAAEAEKAKIDSIAAAEAEKARLDSIAKTKEVKPKVGNNSKAKAVKKEEPKTVTKKRNTNEGVINNYVDPSKP